MVKKRYISAQQLLEDSFNLGLQILESGFKPGFIVAIWRGGTPIGIAVQELLEYFGVNADHIAIRTSLYSGVDQRESEVRVHGLGYVLENISADSPLLIVDDVHDTGLSVQQVIADIQSGCGDNCPSIRVATPYYKPARNQTGRVPDYYLHETEQWLVFPHELEGLSIEEIVDQKPGMEHLRERLSTLSQERG